MKLIPGVMDGLISEWGGKLYNNHIDRACRPYAIPINASVKDELYWFIEFQKQPESIAFFGIDVCACTTGEDVSFGRYVIGEDTNGNYYGVLSGIDLPDAKNFAFAVEVVYTDNSRQFFFSQEYRIVAACEYLGLLYACYGPTDNGGYDENGVYYGYPELTIDGDPTMRYFHNYTMLGLKFLFTGRQQTFTGFNSRPLRADSVITYTSYGEAVPYWYEAYLAAAMARGIVQIDGGKYRITDYQSTIVGEACCESLSVKATAQKTFTTTYACSIEICDISPCTKPGITGVISGCNNESIDKTIAVSGTKPFTLAVVNAAGYTIEKVGDNIRVTGTINGNASIQLSLDNCGGVTPVTIPVTGTCCLPVIAGLDELGNLPAGRIGVAYSQSYPVTSIIGPATLDVQTKPDWMTITYAGGSVSFTGTPTASGTTPVLFTLTNECGIATYSLQLAINATAVRNPITIYQSSAGAACGGPVSRVAWTSSGDVYPTVGMALWSSSSLTTLFNSGTGGWFGIDWIVGLTTERIALRIDNGIVVEVLPC